VAIATSDRLCRGQQTSEEKNDGNKSITTHTCTPQNCFADAEALPKREGKKRVERIGFRLALSRAEHRRDRRAKIKQRK